ncbi:cation diffusion facilitator family transporter [Stella humosa]|uniref:Cation diffusion facilitator family transporter n=2 Tax=Stella humosa TaxID=94 RepID=A0A3N1KT26_9PROT|nr:cation diffusion facilitator family transporter [Stella humosa]BBK32625.1 hypothetical protein STHU_32590 [Stella humosa]
MIRNGLAVDIVMWSGYLGLALWTGALTIVAECLQSGITLGLSALSLVVLWRINRGRLADYDFGTGKLEQAVSLLTALAIIGGSLFVMAEIAARFRHFEETESAGLLVALGVVALDFVVDVTVLTGMRRAATGTVSPVVDAERKARLTRCVASSVVVMSVAVSALLGGRVGIWADLVGSAFLSLFMLWLAFGIVRRVLPDLLDKALDEELQLHINRALVGHFDRYESLGQVRSRRAGSRLVVEIELGFAAALPLGEVVERLAALRAELERDLPGSHVVLIPTVAA